MPIFSIAAKFFQTDPQKHYWIGSLQYLVLHIWYNVLPLGSLSSTPILAIPTAIILYDSPNPWLELLQNSLLTPNSSPCQLIFTGTRLIFMKDMRSLAWLFKKYSMTLPFEWNPNLALHFYREFYKQPLN